MTAGSVPLPAFVRRAYAFVTAGIGLRQIRITCGLILFTYLLSHFANHALGLVSFAAMQDGLDLHMQFWRDPLVAAVFFTAAVTHWGLGLWALYVRRRFRYPAAEITQLVLGVSIPFLLVTHFVGVRLQTPLYDRYLTYAQVIVNYWVAHPWERWLQYMLLLVAWTHGCIGLYYWLRLKRHFPVFKPFLFAAAILIPTLAILGLHAAAHEVIALNADPAWHSANFGPDQLPTSAQAAQLERIRTNFLIGYSIVLALIFAARGLRRVRERAGGTVTLTYPDGKVVRIPKGQTVLEGSLAHHIPHASVCGGRARCSTCRIRIVGDLSALPEPSRREAYVLERVGASGDPAVRLACQLRPHTDVTFYLVFPTNTTAATMWRSVRHSLGEERYVVSLFVDMRRSTSIAERRLPFDTMFLINRFVAAVSRAVEANGGQPNQFLGDGVLALFGLDCGPELACRQALAAIAAIAANVEQLNREFAADLAESIRFGIGVNGGEVVVGDVGYKDNVVFTALGDAVNVAARLQDLTKELDCEALVAEDVCRRAGLASDALPARQVAIRGRRDPLSVRAAADARRVPAPAG
jgi:adenylate cyclase